MELQRKLAASSLENEHLKSILKLAAEQDEENVATTEQLMAEIVEENRQLKKALQMTANTYLASDPPKLLNND